MVYFGSFWLILAYFWGIMANFGQNHPNSHAKSNLPGYLYVMNYNFVTTEPIFKIQNSAKSYCLPESGENGIFCPLSEKGSIKTMQYLRISALYIALLKHGTCSVVSQSVRAHNCRMWSIRSQCTGVYVAISTHLSLQTV